MALKTFNIDDKAYRQFSDYCKKQGISMSKRIDFFIKRELEKIKGHHLPIKETSKKENSSPSTHQEISPEHHSFAKYC
jgi:antitoxin component of RelBE/YafQ-DinJ toxin-antitoxin module